MRTAIAILDEAIQAGKRMEALLDDDSEPDDSKH